LSCCAGGGSGWARRLAWLAGLRRGLLRLQPSMAAIIQRMAKRLQRRNLTSLAFAAYRAKHNDEGELAGRPVPGATD